MAKSSNSQGMSKHIGMAFIATIGGFAAIGLLMNLFVLNDSGDKMQGYLSDTYAAQYATVLNSGFDGLQRRVEHVAQNSMLSERLLGEGAAAAGELEQIVRMGFPEAVRVRVLPRGTAAAEQEQGKIGFADRDAAKRAEEGLAVPAELRPTDGSWQIHFAIPIQSGGSGPIRGTLLLSTELDSINRTLSAFNRAAGQMKLMQKIEGGQPQEALAYGSSGDRTAETEEITLNNPNWVLRFKPSARLRTEVELVNNAMFWALIGVGALIALAGTGFAFLSIQRVLGKDVQLLANTAQGQVELEAAEDQVALQPLRQVIQAMAQSGGLKTRKRSSRPKPVETAQASEGNAAGQRSSRAPGTPFGQTDSILDEEDAGGDDKEGDLGSSPPEAPPPPQSQGKSLPAEIFRAYDVRGVVGKTVDNETAYLLGRAIATTGAEQQQDMFVVGCDARMSSPALSAELIRGLNEGGRNVVNIGVTTTPVVYFATCTSSATSGVVVTGSHNPPTHNGFKIVINGQALAGEQITALQQCIEQGAFVEGQGGAGEQDITESYLGRILEDIVLPRKLKVVIDCGNGVAGALAPTLMDRLGCEVVPLYCEPDGMFPNHHPDPSKPENLQDLIEQVHASQADVGLAFDGDGDRVGVVTNKGTIIYPDRLMMLFARDVITRNPGAEVIFDVKCSRDLGKVINECGGKPTMWRTGHSMIKAKMRETGALLGGEMSGHIFFKERWYGFDDGLYAAARLLELLATSSEDAETLFQQFPASVSTPEINIAISDSRKFALVDDFVQAGEFDGGSMTTLDGVRVDFAGGWGLLRASNTTDNLVLRFEAGDDAELARLQGLFRDRLQAVEPGLTVPF